MTLLGFDGMLDSGTVLKTEWTGGFQVATTGRDGQTNGAMSPNVTTAVWNVPGSGAATFINGWAWGFLNSNSLGNPGSNKVRWCTSGQANQLCLVPNTLGQIELRRTDNTGALLATSSGHPTIHTGEWHHFQCKTVLSTTTGSCQVLMDGVQIINFSGVTSGVTGNVTQLQILSGIGVAVCLFDDMWFCDAVDATATQGAPYNDFLGDLRIQSLFPTAAGDDTQWTPSVSPNWGTVDEVPPNTTDYNAATTTGLRDLYNLTDLAGTIANVYAVQVGAYAAKTDAGAINYKTVLKENSVLTKSASIAPSTSYIGVYDVIRPLKGSSSTAWTATDINNLQAGVEIA